jgi:hypothetical protein
MGLFDKNPMAVDRVFKAIKRKGISFMMTPVPKSPNNTLQRTSNRRHCVIRYLNYGED